MGAAVLKRINRPKINQNSWDLEAVIRADHVIPQRYFDQAPPDVVENFQKLLSRDVFSEGDARSLYDHVQGRKSEMSEDFLKMLALWLQDESKHYEGLRRTYHSVAGVSYETMTQLFAARTHEIEPIERLFEDEFSILVAMMFDEIGSVYSYRRDLREYYRHFGPEIKRMGHHLVKDEGMHFSNAAELLLSHHAHRLAEVEPLLEEISRLSKTLKKYHQSFFLDHAQEHYRFPDCFNQVTIQVILARLKLANQPGQEAVRSLWQWVPAGCILVPV